MKSWFFCFAAAVVVLAGCKERGLDTIADDDRQGQPDGGPTTPGCPPDCDEPLARDFPRETRPNPIPAENALPGDPRWRDGRNADKAEVELYTSTESLFAGERFTVKVSTSVAAQVTAEVYRIGHYGGAGARKIWSGGPFTTSKQAACSRSSETGRIECGWGDTFEVATGADWVSGYYLVKVVRSDGFRRFTPLVIKDRRRAELVYGTTFNTYQAYNVWGGLSLYADSTGTMPSGRSYEVSYDRPYAEMQGTGKLFELELPLVAFLERHGYDVTYVTNLDFVRYGGLLEDGIAAFVHGSQDEYWHAEQRAQIDAALASGKISLAYFGGNGAYWRTRAVAASDGTRFRTLACYKNAVELDPQPGSTVRFRDEPNAHPENALFGVMYDGWQLTGFPLVVRDPSHWLFDGTGVVAGEQLPGLVGFEYDKMFDNGAQPEGLSVAFESPVVSAEGIPSRAHGVARTLPNGRVVFAAGTIWWPRGLGSDPKYADPRVQRMTLNVLERILSHRRARRTDLQTSGAIPTRNAPIGAWARSVTTVVGSGVAGHADGPAQQARFNGPTGLAVTAADEWVIADTGNNRIRLVGNDPARTVTTIAGDGRLGLRDGPGAQAMFRAPTDVAVGPDGAIYVADSDNHVIRRIARDGSGWTVGTFVGAGRNAGYADGPAESARFRRPTSLAFDAAGNLYIADQAGNRIRKVDAVTRTVSTLAGSGIGFADAAEGALARFNNPSAIGVTANEVVVFDAGNQRVRAVSLTPPHAVTTFAGTGADGFRDGPGATAEFRGQMGLEVTVDADILIADTANFRLRKISTATGDPRVLTIAGSGLLGLRDGAGDVADLTAPAGIAALDASRLLVSDSFHHVLRLVER